MTIAAAKLLGFAKLKMAVMPTGQHRARQNPIVATILSSCFSFITSKRSNKVINRFFFARESVIQYYSYEQSTVDCAETFATVLLGILLTTME